ncbi:MAG TPA: ATP-grasp domain-containing protein, partial [Candidatus Dojkabacteria bacterium]
GKWLCDEFVLDLGRSYNPHQYDIIIPLVTSQLELWATYETKFLRSDWVSENWIAEFIEFKNTPLEAKWNRGFMEAKKYFPDFCLYMGSTRRIIISEHDSLVQVNNKLELMNACDRLGIDRPFYTTSDLCMKPTNSNGGRGFERIDNPENKLIMEYLPGREWSVDCLVDHRKAIAIIPRTRDKIKAGISVETTVTYNEKIINDCKKIIESFNLFGPIGFQFKEDKNGTPKIIECNPRCQGSMCITGYAGFDIINNAVKLAAGQRLNEPDIKWGTKMIRYWNEIYV